MVLELRDGRTCSLQLGGCRPSFGSLRVGFSLYSVCIELVLVIDLTERNQ
jgi:hypothetical protein